MTTQDTQFREIFIIISILSLLCSIAYFISLMFLGISYSHSSFVYVSTKDYTYTYQIDVSKEDYRDIRTRLENQDYYYNWYLRINYISFIFTIGVIEELFRIDIFNLIYYTKSAFSENYDSTLYIFSIIEAITEFVIVLIYICLEFWNKKKE